jgi:hypothetical protein
MTTDGNTSTSTGQQLLRSVKDKAPKAFFLFGCVILVASRLGVKLVPSLQFHLSRRCRLNCLWADPSAGQSEGFPTIFD